jgi:glycosyltransferase involved in cell wall biosynthesis
MVLVSVIIPTYNGAQTLNDCLRSITAQSLPRDQYEVIVVDDGSIDASASIISAYAVTYVRQEHRGAPVTRNTGARLAAGDWLAFTDHDCIPSRNWLRNLLAAVDDDRVWGAAGKTIGYESRSNAARYVDLTGGLDAEKYLTRSAFPWAPTCNVIYRRSAFEAIGGFDEHYLTYEYCDLHYQMRRASDLTFNYEPRALVLHRHRATWRQYWQQQFFYGRGYAQFIWNHRDQFQWGGWREAKTWGRLLRLAVQAVVPGADDRALLRRGAFIKEFAQHLGFRQTYYNRVERARWQTQAVLAGG